MHADLPVMPRRTAPFIVGVVLAVVSSAPAQVEIDIPKVFADVPETKPQDKAKENGDAKPAVRKLTVGECIQIAQERQPKLAALRASLSSAQTSQQAIESAGRIAQFSPQYPFRKQQAANGVLAAQAELDQATYDVTYSVVWTYYSVVYAKAQLKVAREAVEFVDYYREQVEKIVNDKKAATREINQLTLNRLIARLAEGKRQLHKAEAGVDKANAALREAMGVDETLAFEPADTELPTFETTDLKKDVVVAHAQTRRGEVIMAGIATEVTRLEAYAQWSLKLRMRTQTFASGGDIHARSIPPGYRNGEYRPDAIGPEMPTNFFGHRQYRTQKAWELAARSEAVLEKTRNLVTLEAENAYADYFYAGKSIAEGRKQAEAGRSNLTALKEAAGDKISKSADLQALLEAQGDAAMGQAAYNDAVRQRISALANIERITAGGVKVNYPGR